MLPCRTLPLEPLLIAIRPRSLEQRGTACRGALRPPPGAAPGGPGRPRTGTARLGGAPGLARGPVPPPRPPAAARPTAKGFLKMFSSLREVGASPVLSKNAAGAVGALWDPLVSHPNHVPKNRPLKSFQPQGEDGTLCVLATSLQSTLYYVD